MADYAASSAAQRQRGRAQAPHTELLHGKGQKLGRFGNHCVVMYEAYLFVSGQKPKLFLCLAAITSLLIVKKGKHLTFSGLFGLFTHILSYQPFLVYFGYFFFTFLALFGLISHFCPSQLF